MDLHMREMSEIGKFMGWHQVENHNEVRDLTEENLEVRFPGPSLIIIHCSYYFVEVLQKNLPALLLIFQIWKWILTCSVGEALPSNGPQFLSFIFCKTDYKNFTY